MIGLFAFPPIAFRTAYYGRGKIDVSCWVKFPGFRVYSKAFIFGEQQDLSSKIMFTDIIRFSQPERIIK